MTAPHWTEDSVEDLLQHPHRLVERDPWRGAIAAAGGLAGLYDRLRGLPLKDKQAAVLRMLLDQPGAGVAVYTARLHIHHTTFARQQRALIKSLVLLLNAAPAGEAPAPQVPRQLRPPVSDFVGRADELARLGAALGGAARGAGATLAAVHGMGGVGKTELAQLAAHQARALFPDGQVALNLRGSHASPLAPELALQAVLRAVTGADRLPAGLAELEDLFRSALTDRRVLILADDARDAAQVRSLVPPVGCALLVTSRQRWTLPGLAQIDLDVLPADLAARLLGELCPRLASEQAAAVAAAVGCLPLALRVSGALLQNNPGLAAERYLQRLAAMEQRLAALRDPDDPQLDVAGSLELSYAALAPAAQSALRRLAVLHGDFEIGLALAAIGAGEEGEDALHTLLRRNLISYHPTAVRWRLHDLIRALALRHAAEQERDEARWRYADEVLGLLDALGKGCYSGHSTGRAELARFDAERHHTDAVWAWLAGQAGTGRGDAAIIRFAGEIPDIGNLRYLARPTRLDHVEQALAAARRQGRVPDEVQFLGQLGVLYRRLGDLPAAAAILQQALLVLDIAPDPSRRALVSRNLASCLSELGGEEQLRRAHGLNHEALALFRELGQLRQVSNTLNNDAIAYSREGRLDEALRVFGESLALARSIGYESCEQLCLQNLGELSIKLNDLDGAARYAQAGLALARERDDTSSSAYGWASLGKIHACGGRFAEARDALATALPLFEQIEDGRAMADCRWAYGLVLLALGEPGPAWELLRAAVDYGQATGLASAAKQRQAIAALEAGTLRPQDAVWDVEF